MCTAYHHDGFRYTFTYQQSYDHLEVDAIWNIQYDSHCNSVAFRNSILYLLQDEYVFLICICKYTYVYIYICYDYYILYINTHAFHVAVEGYFESYSIP